MTDILYLDEYGNTVDDGKEIHELIDGITDMLATMTKAERLNWFRKSQYPYSINFDMKIGNTVYSVSSHFNRTANESLQEKAQRIILNKL